MSRSVSSRSADVVAVVNGELDVRDWETEELVRGERRPWRGKAPRVVPRECVDELRRRQHSKAEARMLQMVDRTLDVLEGMVDGEIKATMPRVRSVEIVLERTLGKTPERVEMQIEQPWQVGIREAISALTARQDVQDAEIIDARVVEIGTGEDEDIF